MARTCVFSAAVIVAAILSVAHAQGESEWLTEHNAARSAVGVAPLAWNESAAAYALTWAQTQAARADCPVLEHSPDLNFSRPYGENIAYKHSPSTPTMVVDMWVSEKAFYDYANNTCSAGEFECLHYTQVVWAATTSLGCGSATCANNASYIYYVCSYYPRGNVDGEWPY